MIPSSADGFKKMPSYRGRSNSQTWSSPYTEWYQGSLMPVFGAFTLKQNASDDSHFASGKTLNMQTSRPCDRNARAREANGTSSQTSLSKSNRSSAACTSNGCDVLPHLDRNYLPARFITVTGDVSLYSDFTIAEAIWNLNEA